jgi:hypothetical protein
MMPEKPMIVLLSGPNDKKFSWLSVGWHTVEQSDSTAKALMARATEAIKAGQDVTHSVQLLPEAGVKVISAEEWGICGDPDFDLNDYLMN